MDTDPGCRRGKHAAAYGERKQASEEEAGKRT